MFDKLKQLTKDTAVYGISTIVGRFLTFLLVPFYTNVLSRNDFGIYTNLYIFLGIFNIIFIYGMDSAYIKFAAVPEEGEEKNLFSTPYLTISTVGIILVGLIFLFKRQIFWALDVPAEYFHLIYYAAGILFVDALCVIPFIKLRLEHKAKKFALFKIINILVNVGLNLFLILKLKWGIEAIFFANLAASLTSFILLFPSVAKSFTPKIRPDILKKLLKFGLPYFPAGLAAMLIQGIDRPILTHLTNQDINGLYAANYKLGIFMMLFVNMFQYAWQPFFMQTAQEKDAKQVFSKVLTYFTLAASVILIVISLFISDAASISIAGHTIIGREYLSGLSIVPVILLAYLFNGMYVIFTAGIFIEEKSIYVPILTGIGAVVNIVLCFVLIPPMGIMGAALATLASYFTMAVGYFIVTQKIYKIDYEYGKILKVFASVLIVGAVYYVQYYGGHLNLLNKFLMLLLFIILLAVFNVGKEEIQFLRKKFAGEN